MEKKYCIICRKPLKDGIIINGRGMCKLCEERLIKMELDTDFYEYYKECIKKSIIEPMIKGEDIKCQSYHL